MKTFRLAEVKEDILPSTRYHGEFEIPQDLSCPTVDDIEARSECDSSKETDCMENEDPIKAVIESRKIIFQRSRKAQLHAIQTTDLCYDVGFGYQQKRLLNFINLNVPAGGIYGLIGPSGSGKTTLLKTVLGNKRPTSGSVKVFGYLPGSVESGVPGAGIGYMPQEIALQGTCTVYEMLLYFGRLYFIDEQTLKERIDYLLEILEITDRYQLIQSMSGGQQRRSSLAVVLVHKPRLLILDEPTSGVDPLLASRIWQLLLHMASTERVTTLITTHYIQEAVKAHRVGFLRQGILLSENSPKNLLQEYEAPTLEVVFYKLCLLRLDGEEQNDIRNEMKGKRKKGKVNFPLDKLFNPCEPFKQHRSLSGSEAFYLRVMILIWKLGIQTLREPTAALWLIALPVFAMGMFKVVIGKLPVELEVGWVSDEWMPNGNLSLINGQTDNEELWKLRENRVLKSRELVDSYYANKRKLRVKERPYFSDLLRKTVNQDNFLLRDFKTFDEAHKEASDLNIWGFVYFNKNFTKSFLMRNFGDIDEIDEGSLNTSRVWIHGDLSSLMHFQAFTMHFALYYEQFLSNVSVILNRTIHHRASIVQSVDFVYGTRIEDEVLGLFQLVGGNAIWYLVLHAVVCSTAVSVAAEKLDGMFIRNYVTGVRSLEIITAQFMFRSLVSIPIGIVSIVFGFYVFDVKLENPLWMPFLFMFYPIAFAVLFGIFIGIISPNVSGAVFAGLSFVYAIFSISGCLYPVDSLPYYAKWFNDGLPLKHLTDTFNSMLIRKDAPFHPFMWRGPVMTLAYSVVLFIVNVILLDLQT